MGQSIAQEQIKALDGCFFNYPQLMESIKDKPRINFNQVESQCKLIGQGYCGKIYLYKKLDIVLKIMKGSPNVEQIIKEVHIMEKVNSIWPNLFQYLVMCDDVIVGFSMKYFQGQKIWQAFSQPENIFRKSPQARIRLVKKLKLIIQKLQSLKVCHGDLHIDNIMIKQPNSNSEQCQILIIDYGLAFIIDDYKPQKPGLTGWQFMRPPEARTQYYYDTAGINAYMFGRVALQILLLEKYDDYTHFRELGPGRQLDMLSNFGYHPSVRQQIQLYLNINIKVRNQMLSKDSQMKQQIVQSSKALDMDKKEANDFGWSILNLIRKQQLDQNYYVRHPQKLGYTF